MEEEYLNKQKELILNFARELYKDGEISKETLYDVYFYNFRVKRIGGKD